MVPGLIAVDPGVCNCRSLGSGAGKRDPAPGEVLYYYDGDHREGQSTVVTETRGALQGRRVVRGRETECEDHYRSEAAS